MGGGFLGSKHSCGCERGTFEYCDRCIDEWYRVLDTACTECDQLTGYYIRSSVKDTCYVCGLSPEAYGFHRRVED